jgi:hypothetical protein
METAAGDRLKINVLNYWGGICHILCFKVANNAVKDSYDSKQRVS